MPVGRVHKATKIVIIVAKDKNKAFDSELSGCANLF